MRAHENFERIVYRRLNMIRSKDKLTRLENFIKAVRNKRYSLAPTKLLRKKYLNDSDHLSMKESKTYFCSELVASIYKNLGLLPMEVSAS